jgi:Leucine-rich repeat (LRR) protein
MLISHLLSQQVDGNTLTSVPDEAMRALTNLHTLELQHNQLENFPLWYARDTREAAAW